MTYWLDLFTGETWGQFRRAGGTITGFRKTMERYKKQPQPGDILQEIAEFLTDDAGE